MTKDKFNLAVRAVPIKLLSFLISLFIFFILTPYIIKNLGDYNYGLWVLLNTLISYLSLSEIGAGSALTRELGLAFGKKNKQRINKAFSNGVYLFFLIAKVVLCLTVLISVVIFFINNNFVFCFLFFLMGFNLAVHYVFSPYTSVLQAAVRLDTIYIVTICQTIFHALFVFFVLFKGYGLVAFVSTGIIVNIIFKFYLYWLVKKTNKSLVFNNKLVDKKSIQNMVFYGLKAFGVNIAGILKDKVDNLMIGYLLSVKLITNYSVAEDLKNKGFNVFGFLMEIVNPIFFQQAGAGQKEKLKETFFLVWKTIMLLSFISYACLVLLGREFITLWLGANYLNAYLPLVLLATAFLFEKTQAPASNILYVFDQHHNYAWLRIMEGIFNVGLSYVFVKFFGWGLPGIALGTLIAVAISKIIFQPVLVAKALDIKWSRYQFFYFSRVFLLLICFVIIKNILKYFVLDMYLKLAGAVLFIAVFFALFGFFFFSDTEKKYLFTRLNLIKKR